MVSERSEVFSQARWLHRLHALTEKHLSPNAYATSYQLPKLLWSAGATFFLPSWKHVQKQAGSRSSVMLVYNKNSSEPELMVLVFQKIDVIKRALQQVVGKAACVFKFVYLNTLLYVQTWLYIGTPVKKLSN